jgi:hypothetical protein
MNMDRAGRCGAPNASRDSRLLSALTFGGCAAGLVCMQSKR